MPDPSKRALLSDLSSGGDAMPVIDRAPEQYTLWVCEDCAQPAHGPGDRCSRDRRRTWTRMAEVEYVRGDIHQGAVDRAMLVEQALLIACSEAFSDGPAAAAQYVERAGRVAGGQSETALGTDEERRDAD